MQTKTSEEKLLTLCRAIIGGEISIAQAVVRLDRHLSLHPDSGIDEANIWKISDLHDQLSKLHIGQERQYLALNYLLKEDKTVAKIESKNRVFILTLCHQTMRKLEKSDHRD